MPLDIDISTRSTDVMLDEADDLSNSSSIMSKSNSQFAHLVPKKHNKMLKAMEISNSSLSETTFRFGDKYRYQLWEGKNKFLCGGRIMMGAHANHLLLSITLLVVTFSLFLLGVVPLLHMPILFYVGGGLAVSTLLFLLLTAFTEPGIIPRRPPSKLLESMSEDARQKLQYCHTCRIVRPPRAKHCRYCDNCVEVFDHHCPWTGTCIGVRNYAYFCAFITLATASSAFACGTSAYLIVRWVEGNAPLPRVLMYVRDIVSPLVCAFTLLVFCLVGSLLAFHLFLIGRQQTTNEFLRGVRPSSADYKNSTTGSVVKLCSHSIPETKLLPMWEKAQADDAERSSNAVAHAISSMRSAIENSA
jgi:palmitoyltransferase ZDHHC9/14/18